MVAGALPRLRPVARLLRFVGDWDHRHRRAGRHPGGDARVARAQPLRRARGRRPPVLAVHRRRPGAALAHARALPGRLLHRPGHAAHRPRLRRRRRRLGPRVAGGQLLPGAPRPDVQVAHRRGAVRPPRPGGARQPADRDLPLAVDLLPRRAARRLWVLAAQRLRLWGALRRGLCVERPRLPVRPRHARLPARRRARAAVVGALRLPRHAPRALCGRPRVPARPPRRPRPPRPEPRLPRPRQRGVAGLRAAHRRRRRLGTFFADARPRHAAPAGRRGRLPHPTPCAAPRPRQLDDGPRQVSIARPRRARGGAARRRPLPHHRRPRAAVAVQDAPEHGDRARGLARGARAGGGRRRLHRAAGAPRGGGGDGGDAPPAARLGGDADGAPPRAAAQRAARRQVGGGRGRRDCRRPPRQLPAVVRARGRGAAAGAAAAAGRGGDGGVGRQRLPPLPAALGRGRQPAAHARAHRVALPSPRAARWRRRATRWRRTASRGRWCPSRR